MLFIDYDGDGHLHYVGHVTMWDDDYLLSLEGEEFCQFNGIGSAVVVVCPD